MCLPLVSCMAQENVLSFLCLASGDRAAGEVLVTFQLHVRKVRMIHMPHHSILLAIKGENTVGIPSVFNRSEPDDYILSP